MLGGIWQIVSPISFILFSWAILDPPLPRGSVAPTYNTSLNFSTLPYLSVSNGFCFQNLNPMNIVSPVFKVTHAHGGPSTTSVHCQPH